MASPGAVAVSSSGGVAGIGTRVPPGGSVAGASHSGCPEKCGCGAEWYWRAVVCGTDSLPSHFGGGIYVPSSAACNGAGGGGSGPIAVNQVIRAVGGVCFKVLNDDGDTRYVPRPDPEPLEGPGEPPDGFEWLPKKAKLTGPSVTCVPLGCADPVCTSPRFYLTVPCSGSLDMPAGMLTPAVAAVTALPWYAAHGEMAFIATTAGGPGIVPSMEARSRCVDFSQAYLWEEIESIAEEYASSLFDYHPVTDPLRNGNDQFGLSCCRVRSSRCDRPFLWRSDGTEAVAMPSTAYGSIVRTRDICSVPPTVIPYVRRLDTGESLSGNDQMLDQIRAVVDPTIPASGLPFCVGRPVNIRYSRSIFLRQVDTYALPGRVYEEEWTETGNIPHDSVYNDTVGPWTEVNVTGTRRETVTNDPRGPFFNYSITAATATGMTYSTELDFLTRYNPAGVLPVALAYGGGRRDLLPSVNAMSPRPSHRNVTWSATMGAGGMTVTWEAELWQANPDPGGSGDVKLGDMRQVTTFDWSGAPECGPCPSPEAMEMAHGKGPHGHIGVEAIERYMESDPMRRCRGCGG